MSTSGRPSHAAAACARRRRLRGWGRPSNRRCRCGGGGLGGAFGNGGGGGGPLTLGFGGAAAEVAEEVHVDTGKVLITYGISNSKFIIQNSIISILLILIL